MDDENRAASEANRLYWESDAPVGEIATRLELSRRALYDALRPLPTGEECPRCGGALGYPNRSARASGLAICADCGAEGPAERAEAATPSETSWTWSPEAGREPHRVDRRTLWLGGAALAGALAAAAVTLLLIPED